MHLAFLALVVRWCGKKDRGFAVLVGVRRCDESVLRIPVSPTEAVWEGARFLAKCFLGLGHGFCVGVEKKGRVPDAPLWCVGR
jgi:hypothetical protein